MTDPLVEDRTESEAIPTEPPFPYPLLARSARVEIGGHPLGRDSWLGLRELAGRTGLALSRIVDLPARVDVLGVGEADDAECAVFGFVIALANARSGYVTVDAELARAIVDAVEAKAGGVRGTGRLTATELGLLEYAVLVALDDLARSMPDLGRAGVLESFPSRSDVISRIGGSDSMPIALRVVLGAREGRATVWLPPDFTVRATADTPQRADVVTGEIEVELALSTLSLREEEIGRASPGDVLLLGAADPSALFEGACLVTTTGWRLAPVTFEANRSTSICVAVGALRPEPDRVSAWCEGRLVVRPMIGLRRVRLAALPTWSEGMSLELDKNPDGAIALAWRGRVFARAEEIDVDEELGARLLTWDRSGMGES